MRFLSYATLLLTICTITLVLPIDEIRSAEFSRYALIYVHEDNQGNIFSGRQNCVQETTCTVYDANGVSLNSFIGVTFPGKILYSVRCKAVSCIFISGKSTLLTERNNDSRELELFLGKETTGLDWPIKKLIARVSIALLK